jgi:hypothetical protein
LHYAASLQLALSSTNGIGDTRYNIHYSKDKIECHLR